MGTITLVVWTFRLAVIPLLGFAAWAFFAQLKRQEHSATPSVSIEIGLFMLAIGAAVLAWGGSDDVAFVYAERALARGEGTLTDKDPVSGKFGERYATIEFRGSTRRVGLDAGAWGRATPGSSVRVIYDSDRPEDFVPVDSSDDEPVMAGAALLGLAFVPVAFAHAAFRTGQLVIARSRARRRRRGGQWAS